MPPRVLRRRRRTVDQVCSVEDCNETAAFSTRGRPTYCDDHIVVLPCRWHGSTGVVCHPDGYLLIRCIPFDTAPHYRFEYVLDKNRWNRATCRACFWRR